MLYSAVFSSPRLIQMMWGNNWFFFFYAFSSSVRCVVYRIRTFFHSFSALSFPFTIDCVWHKERLMEQLFLSFWLVFDNHCINLEGLYLVLNNAFLWLNLYTLQDSKYIFYCYETCGTCDSVGSYWQEWSMPSFCTHCPKLWCLACMCLLKENK